MSESIFSISDRSFFSGAEIFSLIRSTHLYGNFFSPKNFTLLQTVLKSSLFGVIQIPFESQHIKNLLGVLKQIIAHDVKTKIDGTTDEAHNFFNRLISVAVVEDTKFRSRKAQQIFSVEFALVLDEFVKQLGDIREEAEGYLALEIAIISPRKNYNIKKELRVRQFPKNILLSLHVEKFSVGASISKDRMPSRLSSSRKSSVKQFKSSGAVCASST